MQEISAIIITLNEEKNLRKCLTSLQHIADEIIVVDSYSTDRTQEICEEFRVNFIQHQWEGYSASKNFANSQATKKWIFSIDADEEVSEELKKSFLRFKQSEPENVHFSMNRRTNYCGHWVKYCGWYPDRKIRIWKKGTAHWVGVLHETLEFTEFQKSMLLSGDLLHYSFPTINHHWKTIKTFSDILSDEIVRQKKKRSVLFTLVAPPFTFIKKYFFQLGLLDGFYGFCISYLSAVATFMKYAKARMKRQDKTMT